MQRAMARRQKGNQVTRQRDNETKSVLSNQATMHINVRLSISIVIQIQAPFYAKGL